MPPLTECASTPMPGWKTLSLVSRQGGRYTFRAAMGQPERVAEETDRRRRRDADGDDARDRQPAVRGADEGAAGPGALSIASARRSPRIRGLPQGTNVEFAVVEAPDRVRILIWERGVGPTHASGTGACASAIAAIAHGGAARDVEVIAPGGTQRVEWRDDGIFLTGWAEVVFDGHWVPSNCRPVLKPPSGRSFSDHSMQLSSIAKTAIARAGALALAAGRCAATPAASICVKAA